MLEEGAWGWAVAILVILMFVGICIGLFFQCYWLTALCTGAVITVFGILMLRNALKQPKKKLIAPIGTLLAGILVLLNGFLMAAIPQQLEEFKAAHGVLFGKIFQLGVGTLLVVLPLSSRRRRKKCCSAEVEATCIDRSYFHSGRTHYYQCEYEYQYHGESHSVIINDYSIFSRFSKMQVGDVRTIYIDPVYFDEYYIPGDRQDRVWVAVLVGVLLILSGLFFENTI